MANNQELLTKKTYKSTRQSLKRGIKGLQKSIKRLGKNGDIATLQLLIQRAGHIASFGGIDLYFNHVTKSDRSISFESPLDVQLQTSGEVYTTTTGGGSRPTLTRIVAGGLIAGPLGALAGGVAQKHGKTSTSVHDDRKVIITISGEGGYISSNSLSFNYEAQARNFVETVTNASYDYQKQKLSQDAYMSNLTKQLANTSHKLGLPQKEIKLADLQKQKQTLEEKWQKDKAIIREEQKRIRSANKQLKAKQKEEQKRARLAEKQLRVEQKALVAATKTSPNKAKVRTAPTHPSFSLPTLSLPDLRPLRRSIKSSWQKVWPAVGIRRWYKWVIGAVVLISAIGIIGAYNSSPSISVTNAPSNHISTNNAEYTLTGKVVSMRNAKLTVNNQPVPLSKYSKFLYKVPLSVGDNNFVFKATNAHGTTEQIITVHRHD
jgi:hypothetical protein